MSLKCLIIKNCINLFVDKLANCLAKKAVSLIIWNKMNRETDKLRKV